MAGSTQARARRELSAGGVVFRRTQDGPHYLLIRVGGRWSFPKGMVLKGESAEQAALREIAEETGLAPSALHLRASLPDVDYAFRWAGRLVFKRVHNFLVESIGDGQLQPQLSEVEEVRWFASEEAKRRLSFKNSLPILEAAVAAVEPARVSS
jgi:8-oxo-dGTP pyrophosphatase MutT (NUDIX family)